MALGKGEKKRNTLYGKRIFGALGAALLIYLLNFGGTPKPACETHALPCELS